LTTRRSPEFDESANGTKIVHSRKRPLEINRTEKRKQKISPIAPVMAFFIVASWLITFWTTAIHVPSAMAGPMSQQAKSDLRVEGGEDRDSLLDGVEGDINASKFAESEPRLNGYIKDHPDSSRAHYDLGYVQFRTHQIGASIKELSKSLELNPKNAEAHKVLALSCSIIGRYDLAEVELQEAARLKPESAEIHYFLARTYYTRGVYPLAKSEFETSIRLDPSNIKAYSNLGITLEALGDTDAALKNYTTAIQLEDRQEHKSEWPYVYLSSFYNRQKNADEALNYARKAVQINSASDTAYFEMAKAYRTQKQLQKSVDAARSAVAINSRVPDYYYVIGLVLRELGDQQASQEALQKYAQLQQHSNDAVPEHPTEEPLIAPEPQ
jgi:tetratricopeptide (TPR) repeat protein